MTKNVYSEFEVQEQHIKVAGSESYKDMSCVGTSKEELEVKVITKKCRGVKAKEKVKGTGCGKLTQSLHVPYDIYTEMYAMYRQNYAEGVMAYGQGSTHPEFALTQKVVDEDDVVKLKAYPRCVLEEGPKRDVNNGQEDVPELELTIALLPDDNGECMYEILESKASDELKTNWLTGFSPELVLLSKSSSQKTENSTTINETT